jgi:hypothetical protein
MSSDYVFRVTGERGKKMNPNFAQPLNRHCVGLLKMAREDIYIEKK